jgi:hypothetical protein
MIVKGLLGMRLRGSGSPHSTSPREGLAEPQIEPVFLLPFIETERVRKHQASAAELLRALRQITISERIAGSYLLRGTGARELGVVGVVGGEEMEFHSQEVGSGSRDI